MYSAGGSGESKHAHTNTSGALVFSLSTTAKEFNIDHMRQKHWISENDDTNKEDNKSDK